MGIFARICDVLNETKASCGVRAEMPLHTSLFYPVNRSTATLSGYLLHTAQITYSHGHS